MHGFDRVGQLRPEVERSKVSYAACRNSQCKRQADQLFQIPSLSTHMTLLTRYMHFTTRRQGTSHDGTDDRVYNASRALLCKLLLLSSLLDMAQVILLDCPNGELASARPPPKFTAETPVLTMSFASIRQPTISIRTLESFWIISSLDLYEGGLAFGSNFMSACTSCVWRQPSPNERQESRKCQRMRSITTRSPGINQQRRS